MSVISEVGRGFSAAQGGGISEARSQSRFFATTAKPDIRFLNAVGNDIEVLNPDDVLIYDRPITADGILWRDLQSWWKETQKTPSWLRFDAVPG
ncbi:hypothetical protein SAMN05216275_102339 [Streptosporangium canum]|uniref:Uncharacterized protein n=1 Tax=Streptosporangium canum TaxID=324952 RepID=A0A1I3H3Y8_9ACTN|nr:hypothetical protein [Streptosporangium canum]SFI30282.1 hypothetical protein SAMN05216275_102339 [Streptosporangium canum]